MQQLRWGWQPGHEGRGSERGEDSRWRLGSRSRNLGLTVGLPCRSGLLGAGDIQRILPQMVDGQAKQDVDSWLRKVEAENLHQEPRPEILNDFIRLCVRGRLHLLLAAYQIPHPRLQLLWGVRRA